MAYGARALNDLAALIARLPQNGRVLELGAQDVNADVPREVVLSALRAIHGEHIPPDRLSDFDGRGPWRAGELFRNSGYSYSSVDLFPGEFTIIIDLNTFQVPETDRCSYHLITNHGTTEHVADQINCFRVIHDYAAVGATMLHVVPFTGYFNHALYNYHPLFFFFLAHANNYEIERLELWEPHLPYTIPHASFAGADAWSDVVTHSGVIEARLRKTADAPFQLFTDFDQAAMGRMKIAEPWASLIRDRYDLRVRTSAR
jgi:hypothetical protein